MFSCCSCCYFHFLYVFCIVLVDCILVYFFFVAVAFTRRRFPKIFISRFVFPLYLWFVVAVVAVDVDDVVMAAATLLSDFKVCTDTVFLFIAGHLFCNNTSSRLDIWLNKESITLSLFLIFSLRKKYLHLTEKFLNFVA